MQDHTAQYNDALIYLQTPTSSTLHFTTHFLSSTMTTSPSLSPPSLPYIKELTPGYFVVHVRKGDEGGKLAVRTLLGEFRDLLGGLGVDLGSFQDFDAEMEGLPGKYDGENRGALWVVVQAEKEDGVGEVLRKGGEDAWVGTIAFRKHTEEAAEMKRMYVRKGHRGKRLGTLLAKLCMNAARDFGYSTMYLDSLRRLPHAVRTYEALGFTHCEAYIHNPIEDAVFLKVDLHTRPKSGEEGESDGGDWGGGGEGM